MTLYDTTYLKQEEELLSEDASEYSLSYASEHGLSYSQCCSSVRSEPLDLSMSEYWFGDGVEHSFKESVSFTNFINFCKIFMITTKIL